MLPVLHIFCLYISFPFTSQVWDNLCQLGVLVYLSPFGLSHRRGKNLGALFWGLYTVFIRNFLSAILSTPPEIPQKSGRWEEAYVAFLQDFFFYILFCCSGFVARASTSDHCIRRMSVQKGAWGQWGHYAGHPCCTKNWYIRKGGAIVLYIIWLHPLRFLLKSQYYEIHTQLIGGNPQLMPLLCFLS